MAEHGGPMSALQGEDRERLLRIATRLTSTDADALEIADPEADAAFLRNLAEHGCSGEGEERKPDDGYNPDVDGHWSGSQGGTGEKPVESEEGTR